jgi:hypothetical protein
MRGHGRRLRLGEVSITEHNLIYLESRHNRLKVHKYLQHEEILTGADWEWWIGGASTGWTGFCIQAKRMNRELRYDGITRQMKGKRQIDVLIEYCRRRSVRYGGQLWPFYCFYNGWSGPWPTGVDIVDNRRTPSQGELGLFGCCLMPATTVRAVLAGPRGRQTGYRYYLPYSHPWSELFFDPRDSETSPDDRLSLTLAQNAHSWFWVARTKELTSAPDRSIGRYPSQADVPIAALPRWLRAPAVMERPPEYVLALLHGTPGRTRTRPGAKRVAVLELGD